MKCKLSSFVTVLAVLCLQAAASAQILGTAANFAVLGGQSVTNTGPSIVNGDLGVWPGTSITGFPPGTVVGGTTHNNDAVAMQAQSDVTTAYNSLAGMMANQDLTGMNLGGLTLTPGVYTFTSSAFLTGTLTLDGLGDPNALFVFQIVSELITASGSVVSTINGASGCNVYWQVGSSATLGTTTAFEGNILALTSIMMNTGATILDGRALARNGAVTMQSNTVAGTCIQGGGPPACDIDCPPNIGPVNTDPGMCCASVPFQVALPTQPGCIGASIQCTIFDAMGLPTPISSGYCFAVGTTTVTCTVLDAAGTVVDVCAFTVTVRDSQPPTLTCPVPIVQGNDPDVCGATVTYPDPTFVDNCPLPTNWTIVCDPPSGSVFPIGPTLVTCRVLNQSGVEEARCSFLVTVNDTQDPTLTCPEDITIGNDLNQCGAVVTYAMPVINENCPLPIDWELVCNPPSGSFFANGTTTVTCDLVTDDGQGFSVAFCTFDITVEDRQDPSVVCVVNQVFGTDPGVCTSTQSFIIGASDNCPPAPFPPTVECRVGGQLIPLSYPYPIGTTTVECVAIDSAGNRSEPCSFTVTVNDNEGPTFVCLQDAEVEVTRCDGIVLTADDVIVGGLGGITDNCCTEGFTVTTEPSEFECPPLGTPMMITVTVVDCNGQSATCTTNVTFTGSDCNSNGLADACDICAGTSLDCNENWVPDECECFWCNVREQYDAIPMPEVNAQLSHLGGGTPCGEKVADDFYLEPGCMHRITAVRGRLLTNSYQALRRARVELYEDCNGKPVDEPFFVADYNQQHPIPSEVIDVQPALDGYSVVTYRFDLCDQCIWLEGGKTYWVSIIGLPDNIDMTDLSYWVAGNERLPLLGSTPVKRSGTPGSTWGSCIFGPWQSLEDCCIGCVNMDFCVDGYSCPIIWDNGKVDLVNRGGSPSGGHQQYNDRTADNFVIKTCKDEELCLIKAWIWTNCDPVYGFIELYEDLPCGPPELPNDPFRSYSGEQIKTVRLPETWTVGGRTYTLWRLEVKEPNLTLVGGRNYWVSAGAISTGNFNTNSFFAWSRYGCEPCNGVNSYRITPGQHRTVRPPPTEWADVVPPRDFAFLIAAKGPNTIPTDGTDDLPLGGVPDCVADSNNDGNVAVDDIFTFLSAWFVGCP